MPSRLRYRTLLLPLCAALAVARCGSDAPSGPGGAQPEIVHLEAQVAGPGEDLTFHVYFRDTVRIKRVILDITNSFSRTDTFDFDPPVAWIGMGVTIPVPYDASLQTRARAWFTVFDEADRTATGTVSALIADGHPPNATLGLGGLRADQTIGIGDTLELYVAGNDNHRLAYIGYEGAGIRDSVVANLPSYSHTFRLAVLPTWLPVRPVFTAWARDVQGNVSAGGAQMIPVYDGGDRLELTVPLTGQGVPFDAVWDAKRDVVYVLRGSGSGTRAQIDIVHVPTGALGTPIPLPSYPLGFVLSESGDSLVVTFADPRLLAIVDLLPSVRSATVVPVREDLIANDFARTAQVAGGHVFLPMVGGSPPSRVLDLDLATGVQVIRSDIGDGSGLSVGPNLFRLPDGRLFLCPDHPYYPTERFLYSPASNTFTATLELRAAGPGQFSASPSGRFMLGNTIYDAALDSVAAIATQDWREEYGMAAALSADGTTAFLATTYGYEKVRVSDGTLLEQLILGTTPGELLPLPDGNRLIAIGYLPGTTTSQFAVMIVHLR